MNASDVKKVIEATEAEYVRAKVWGSTYEAVVIDGLNLALKTVDECVAQEKREMRQKAQQNP